MEPEKKLEMKVCCRCSWYYKTMCMRVKTLDPKHVARKSTCEFHRPKGV